MTLLNGYFSLTMEFVISNLKILFVFASSFVNEISYFINEVILLGN